MAIRSVTKASKSVVVDKATAKRNIKVSKTAAPSKGKTLWFFQQTPAGKLLRAYFVALVTCQVGGIKPNVPFRLWPYANVAGHLANGRMKRGDKPGTFTLTQAGVNYLTNDEQKPEKDTVAGMVEAVKAGKRPAFYNFELSEMKL